jgi:integrase
LKLAGRRVSTGTSDPKEARRFQIERAAEVNKGNTAALAGGRLTLEDLERRVLADYAANGRRSGRHVVLQFRHLREHLARFRVSKIDEDVLADYVAARLGQGAARATINLELAALHLGMRLFERKLVRVPAIPYLALDNARKGFFERPEFDAILAHLPVHLQAPLEVAYITGWRFQSEVLTRQWHHVDLAAGWIRLEPGEAKNREGRMFPLTPALRAVLEAQRARTDEAERQRERVIPWVFHYPNGGRISKAQKAWESARRKAGLPHRLVHDLRRTAVRNLERAGVPRVAAMKLVGHRTEAMYRRYAITDEAMLRESVAKLEQLHGEQREQAAKVVPLKKG